ncbi:MAG: cell envelope integrity protein TolA [Gammaproteobacteria bacterium]|nr:cell envelope integrity protein TolA [Gammaproteobacteria bacterium]
MVRLTIRRPSGGYKAFLLAVMVHAALVALLVIGFRWQAAPLAPPPAEKIVQAKALNEPEVNQEIERLKRQEERQRREDEAKKKAEAAKQAEAEKKRKAEEQKALDAKRKLEEDRKRKAEAEKKPEKKPKVDEQQKPADAKKAKEKKLEDEARRKDNERALKEQLAAEDKARQQQRRQAEQAQQAMSEIDKYRALIKQKVERSWARPPSAEKGLECLVRVRLIQSGEVIQAKVVRSSGNAAFDRSVENAVYKASPLPLPDDKSLFSEFRELEFIFKPED